VLLVGLAMILPLVFGVTSASFRTNGDFFPYSRNHGLNRGY